MFSSPAAADYLSRFLCIGFALALLAGCASRRFSGGRAITTHKPAGVIDQTLLQGQDAATPSRQQQATVKVRTYTVPAGSRIEPSQVPGSAATQPAGRSHNSQPLAAPKRLVSPQHCEGGSDVGSSAFILSGPVRVEEREESHCASELGAAQKDTARELGAKLSHLSGLVWVGAGAFLFGLLSLVWPPLKVIIASVTTSAALMGGGVALMVLPTLVVGNELLILGGVGVAVGGWFLAHRHGHLRGIVAASAEASPKPKV